MANFLFENFNKKEEKCIEVIKCPNRDNCDNETGDGRYDHIIVPPDDSIKVETECDEICWRYCGGEYQRTNQPIIQV